MLRACCSTWILNHNCVCENSNCKNSCRGRRGPTRRGVVMPEPTGDSDETNTSTYFEDISLVQVYFDEMWRWQTGQPVMTMKNDPPASFTRDSPLYSLPWNTVANSFPAPIKRDQTRTSSFPRQAILIFQAPQYTQEEPVFKRHMGPLKLNKNCTISALEIILIFNFTFHFIYLSSRISNLPGTPTELATQMLNRRKSCAALKPMTPSLSYGNGQMPCST